MSRGYAAAVVVSSHKSDKAYLENGVKLIPCPQQTGRAETCLDCGLCMRANTMHSNRTVIAFAVHGQQEKKAQQALVRIEGIK